MCGCAAATAACIKVVALMSTRWGAASPASIRERSAGPHQFLQPFTVFPTDRQHLTLRVCQRTHRAFQQEMDAHLHTGERCAQLVGGGGDELRLEPINLA